jgi:hypothetical protein
MADGPFYSEVVRHTSECQNEIVVVQSRLIGLDGSGAEIDTMNIGPSKFDKRVPPEETPDGISNLARSQLRRGDLVQER